MTAREWLDAVEAAWMRPVKGCPCSDCVVIGATPALVAAVRAVLDLADATKGTTYPLVAAPIIRAAIDAHLGGAS